MAPRQPDRNLTRCLAWRARTEDHEPARPGTTDCSRRIARRRRIPARGPPCGPRVRPPAGWPGRRAPERSGRARRRTNGSFSGRAAVCPAVNSAGRNHPSVMTAGIAPIRTWEAPRCWAKAGRIVACDANERPMRKRARSPRSATMLWCTSRRRDPAGSGSGTGRDGHGVEGSPPGSDRCGHSSGV